jgi:CheY-like chemotaxis protein
MEAVGQLAGGVAHDFNNILTVIFGHADSLLGSLARHDPRREAVEAILDAASRSAAITRQLLAFGRRTLLQPRVLDLNDVARDTERMLRRLIGEHIALSTAFAPGLGKIEADPTQLTQVLMNLAVNARDAMPRGGRLTIETRNAELGEEYCALHPDVKPGSYAQLVVADTGCGMSAEVKAHIFEPFFTTKGSGKGTGLGLATVYGIVKQSGGHIDVYSEEGYGTTFKLYFPVVEDCPRVLAEEARTAPATSGAETILLAEDEPAVREVARRALEAHGYRVLAAAGGREALRVAEAHEGPIDLLVTDVVMPELGGRELAVALRARHPGLRVMYVSGYADDMVFREGLSSERAAFLEKPYTPSTLARRVRECLDA